MYIEDVTGMPEAPLWKTTEWLYSGTDFKMKGLLPVALCAVFTVPSALFGRAIAILHWAVKGPNEYSIYTGTAKVGGLNKFMTWNVCMMPGCLATAFGGMRPAGARIEEVAKKIREESPDVLCLQEMTRGPAKQLMEKLKDIYHVMYYGIGPNPFGMENGLFFASKATPERTQYVPFTPGMQGGFRRGFFVAEFANQTVVATHLDSKNADVRAAQIQVIQEHLKEEKKEVVLMGDLNLDSQDKAAIKLLESFKNFKKNDVETPVEETSTCWDNCPNRSVKWSCVDHILVRGKEVAQRIVNASSALK